MKRRVWKKRCSRVQRNLRLIRKRYRGYHDRWWDEANGLQMWSFSEVFFVKTSSSWPQSSAEQTEEPSPR